MKFEYLMDDIRHTKIYRMLNDAIWFVRWRTFNRFDIVKTDLNPGYCDVDIRLLHACFSLLCSYVEVECASVGHASHLPNREAGVRYLNNHIKYGNKMSYDCSYDQECLVLYWWWKEIRTRRNYEECNFKLEDVYKTIDQEMLHRLINIMYTLWT